MTCRDNRLSIDSGRMIGTATSIMETGAACCLSINSRAWNSSGKARRFRAILLFLAFFTGVVDQAAGQIAWSGQTLTGVSDGIWSVTFAAGKFVAVTDQGRVLTSSDGTTWNSQTIAAGTWLVSVTYGDGLWVVVGVNGTVMYSSNLQSWSTAASVPTGQRLDGVLYTGSTLGFVAAGEDGTLLVSADGSHWTAQNSGVTGFLHGIIVDSLGSVFVSGQNGVLLRYNGGGANGWAPVNSGTTASLEAIVDLGSETYTTGTDELFFTLSVDNLVSTGTAGTVIFFSDAEQLLESTIASSSTGVGSPGLSNTTADLRALAFGNGCFVAGGGNGALLISFNGNT